MSTYVVEIRDRGVVVRTTQLRADNALEACTLAEAEYGARTQYLTISDGKQNQIRTVSWSGLESQARRLTDQFDYDLTMA